MDAGLDHTKAPLAGGLAVFGLRSDFDHNGGIDHTPAIVTREGVVGDFERYFAEGFSELGAESRHLRFFSAIRELPDVVKQRLADVDGHANAAVVAFDAAVDLPDHPEGKPIGVARWMSSEHGPPELSVTVIDDYQGIGVGTTLMHALLELARRRGVTVIIADVLAENAAMRRLLNRFGAVPVHSEDPTVLVYQLDLL